jgi:hypothetical protein
MNRPTRSSRRNSHRNVRRERSQTGAGQPQDRRRSLRGHPRPQRTCAARSHAVLPARRIVLRGHPRRGTARQQPAGQGVHDHHAAVVSPSDLAARTSDVREVLPPRLAGGEPGMEERNFYSEISCLMLKCISSLCRRKTRRPQQCKEH